MKYFDEGYRSKYTIDELPSLIIKKLEEQG